MRALAIGCIRFYQRYLSPYKGFCCAYRHHTGHQGCSALGLRAIRRYGMLHGLQVLRRRLYLCGVAHRRHAPVYKRPHRSQRGDCDLPLACDLDTSNCGTAFDVLCCAGDIADCDWRRRNAADEKHVYIPPNSLRGAQARKNPGEPGQTRSTKKIRTTSAT